MLTDLWPRANKALYLEEIATSSCDPHKIEGSLTLTSLTIEKQASSDKLLSLFKGNTAAVPRGPGNREEENEELSRKMNIMIHFYCLYCTKSVQVKYPAVDIMPRYDFFTVKRHGCKRKIQKYPADKKCNIIFCASYNLACYDYICSSTVMNHAYGFCPKQQNKEARQ